MTSVVGVAYASASGSDLLAGTGPLWFRDPICVGPTPTESHTTCRHERATGLEYARRANASIQPPPSTVGAVERKPA